MPEIEAETAPDSVAAATSAAKSDPPTSPVPVVVVAAKPASSLWTRLFGAFVILVVAGLIVFGGFFWLGKRSMDSARETVMGLAEAFRPETISLTFARFTELAATGTEGNILEVVTAEATETFTRKTNVVWFDHEIPLGTTISEISVPATYRYHIDLNGEWGLTAHHDRVTVIAPAIQPSLPVAFDSGRMEKKTSSGWARWDGDESLDELERTLTAKLGERAKSAKTIDQVRSDARLAVAKFVRNWLLEREHWGDSTYREIVVVFGDEIGGAKRRNLMDRSATLRLGARSGPVLP